MAFGFALLAFGLFLARPATAGNDGIVKGTVSLPPDTGSPKDVVVYLEGALGTPAPRKATIDQKDKTFTPHVVAIGQGGTVEFLNNDPMYHNVFSISPAKRFDLGMFGKGETRAVTFDKPGIVKIRCNVHPGMEAFVLVLENDYFAIPDERGQFQISGIPAGRYKLRTWHESLPEVQTWVNLDEAKLRNVDLRLQK